ncbi:LOW QUALITY PROTEIN: hypothetical protein PanWU01x14_126630 [Parasponia andersonii]|uniref:Uncharacterized protein n=1 Tax=Parasponia andersonii TaxID=3476 RepID=A0A2P5CSZ7_PARAD|nr:LOW QUALITY PROTEIN: hypothetical protein PanWU01x14_126630 [Parasponia andersonii]
MHHTTPGEINRSGTKEQLCRTRTQWAVRRPNQVGHHRVHETSDEDREHEVSAEPGPSRDGGGCYTGGGHGGGAPEKESHVFVERAFGIRIVSVENVCAAAEEDVEGEAAGDGDEVDEDYVCESERGVGA